MSPNEMLRKVDRVLLFASIQLWIAI